MLQEMKLPKEIVSHILAGVDETKHAAVAIVAKEVRQFLEQTDLADEIDKVMSQLSLEVSIKFVPTEKISSNNGEDPGADHRDTHDAELTPFKTKALDEDKQKDG